ncbi:iron-sulfur cluster repair di-iron protein [Geobacter pickeringii]|uniref:Iron-sulfur cluster repair protein ScdA n=1 Tax=Geobacter pickeringii TaxID=345632 RepID=A0A0B5BD86_9BACT|nr:iron-sulfur cluster repair di-iron protein [Geobacter pickeringii]AJE04688.1 iron-sulfur cluster repair protein ScdA [Geobacter pickeringii]
MNDEKTLQAENGGSTRTIGGFVAEDYRTAEVFERHGIDFCCGGNVPLDVACRQKGIDPAVILGEIEAAKQEPMERSQNFAAWELPFLADYIVAVHHAYIKDNAGQITLYARKVAEVHGSRHPEVKEIAAIFDGVATDLAAHLREEEEVFFPAVKRADAARKAGRTPEQNDIEAISGDLVKLRREHEEVGDAIHTIRRLAGDFVVPGDACNTYTVTYRKLKEFEDDLHKHVHLENNILFLKAERELISSAS